MGAASFDIKDILESESSLGLLYANNLFVGKEIAHPKNAVFIMDVPGFPPELTLEGNSGYSYPSIQIKVRNTKYSDAMQLANDIKEQLHGRAGETWNGSFYSVIYCTGDPAVLAWDDNGMVTVVINFNLQRR
jgi:hypothetical protein